MQATFEQLYFNGCSDRPTIVVVKDQKNRSWNYDERDGKVAIGKLTKEPRTMKESSNLADRCRMRSGVRSISWYSFGRDVIEIDLSDLKHIEAVAEAYEEEGFPIEFINY